MSKDDLTLTCEGCRWWQRERRDPRTDRAECIGGPPTAVSSPEFVFAVPVNPWTHAKAEACGAFKPVGPAAWTQEAVEDLQIAWLFREVANAARMKTMWCGRMA